MKFTVLTVLIFVTSILFCQAVEPIYLTLNGDITNPDQEVSGLAWHNDTLVLLPQYPQDVIYSIPKQQIIDFLDSALTTILPAEIKWNDRGINKRICGFEGFESIIFDEDQVFMTIEAERARKNLGFIVRGHYDRDDNEIKLVKKSKTKIKPPIFLINMTYETILQYGSSIITIYEVNSEIVNRAPTYYEFDKEFKTQITKPFPATEFRITDATEIDSAGKFWVTNYFWPGDYDLLKLSERDLSKDDIKPVERLLEFQFIDGTIVRTETLPIDIQISEFGDSRNWEGIVRLDNRGFLLVTDKFPGTILAFVPMPN